MNTTKQNENVKFKVVNVDQEATPTNDTTILDEDTTTNDTSSAVEPVDALIEYISTKYELDTSKQIHEYVDKINREGK